MFKKTKDGKEIDYDNVNEILGLSSKILKIVYVFIMIIGAYALTVLFKELKFISFIMLNLKIISPLFIGILIAWLFDPFVRYLNQKGIKRGIGAVIIYTIFLSIIYILISAIIPVLTEQINELAKTAPSIFDVIKLWVDNLFEKVGALGNIDLIPVKKEMFLSLERLATEIPSELPKITVNIVKSIFSGLGVFVVGLVIGFYLLVSFDNSTDSIITLLPNKYRGDARDLVNEVNASMRKFVHGTLLGATIIFCISTIGFALAGMKGALLFGLFCGITNIIPFIGPYIGGIPAVIVAFTQNTKVGMLVLLIIVVVQFIEGNFIQPMLMSKMMKLHPVTIMLGLLIFGHYWGILGMVLATPVIAASKSVLSFINDRFNILPSNNT